MYSVRVRSKTRTTVRVRVHERACEFGNKRGSIDSNEISRTRVVKSVRYSRGAFETRRECTRVAGSARDLPRVHKGRRELMKAAENERESPRVHDSRVDARDLQSLNSRQLFEMLRRWAWCASLKTSGNSSARKLFYEHIVSLNTENYTKLRNILG